MEANVGPNVCEVHLNVQVCLQHKYVLFENREVILFKLLLYQMKGKDQSDV